ncbi:MAG: hypothetical protein IT323_08475 [Anaerolineae bacterium]|nr:hypothetical protein [Anaerolineae bacterium]
MTSRDRLIGLGLVWLIYAALLGYMISQGPATVAVSVPFMVFLTLVTLLASFFLTRGAAPAANQDQGSARAARDRELTAANPKAKRSDLALVDRLIDSMSDSELDALRQRLEQSGSALGADGELTDDDIDLERLRRRSR